LGDPTLNTTTFQPSDWQKQMQFVALLMPEVLDGTETARDWWTPHGVSLTISWVVMSLVSGTYHAHVAWSLSNDVNALRTACNGKTLSFQQDDAPFDIDKLPVSLRADGSAIVVDLKFEHQLTFTDRFLWPTSFQSSSYFAPRNVDKILFQDGPVSSDFVAPQKSVCAAFNQ
jgi:hypothetical protein